MPANWIRKHLRNNGFGDVEVYRTGVGADGMKWIIAFYGYNNILPEVKFNSAKLTGGKTKPRI